MTLELLIRLQKGLTSKLLWNVKSGSGPRLVDLHLALFSGPHRLNTPLVKFRTVLLMASELGITAQLLYLQQLICGYNDFEVCTHCIHLVWQLQNLGK